MEKGFAYRASFTLLALLFITVSFYCCEPRQGRDDFPVLEGDYLGQTPPGPEPEIFARDIISDPMQNRDVAISPDGDEMYFGLASAGIFTIIRSERVD